MAWRLQARRIHSGKPQFKSQAIISETIIVTWAKEYFWELWLVLNQTTKWLVKINYTNGNSLWSCWSSTNIAPAWFHWNERFVCRKKREELYHKIFNLHCSPTVHIRTMKLCWQCSGTLAKYIRAACDCISLECVAFSLRCCPHLLHYSLKLAATASVPAFDLTSAPSNRKKRIKVKERDKE